MRLPEIAILHYSAPPVIGGVEAVIEAHARLISEAGYPLTVIAGRGEAAALPAGANLVQVPEMDSLHPTVLRQNQILRSGQVPPDFESLVDCLETQLSPLLKRVEVVILHNIFTKHFNLALTAASFRMVENRKIKNCIAWCHDFTWTSENSRSAVHPGYPWDLLRTPHPDVKYVVVSQHRRQELAGLLGYTQEKIDVIYNGVDPASLLGLSAQGLQLATRLGLLESDLVLLMPVRVTQAKNIEYAMQLAVLLKQYDIRTRVLVTGPPDPHDERNMAYFNRLLEMRKELGVEEEMRFIFNSGENPEEPFFLEANTVGEIYRMSDLLFMPSHREGFGMPVLEAGMVGIQVITTEVPAAVEIGVDDVIFFDKAEEPALLARRILDWASQNPIHRMRRRIRQSYTWSSIFHGQIKPLLGNRDGRQDPLHG